MIWPCLFYRITNCIYRTACIARRADADADADVGKKCNNECCIALQQLLDLTLAQLQRSTVVYVQEAALKSQAR